MSSGAGARFTLRLNRSDPDVVYGFEVELPEATLTGVATVEREAGAVRIDSEVALPGWLESTVVGLLRSLWRARRDSTQADPWPRRLTRWRRGEATAEK